MSIEYISQDEVARAHCLSAHCHHVVHHRRARTCLRCVESPPRPRGIIQLTDFALVTDLGTAVAH